MLEHCKISVIMPVYNAEKYIVEATESILEQTYTNFEFIIIDDCSTDDSYNILQKFAAKDGRIKLFRNDKNYKQAYSRNIGIKHSCGKYIVFMDADDIALPERLMKQVEFMESHSDIDIAGVWYVAYNQDMSHVLYMQRDPCEHWEIIINMHLFRNALAQYVIIRRHVFDSIMYDPSFKNLAEDYELWLRAINYGFKFANINQFLMKYRVYNESSCHENLPLIDSYIQSVHKKHLKNLLQMRYRDSIAKDHERLIYRNKSIYFFLKNLCSYKKHLDLLRDANKENQKYSTDVFDKVIQQLSLSRKIYNKLKKIFKVES